MEIMFLGTGSAFTLKGFNSNLIIKENDKNFLVDAGTDIRFSLAAAGMSYKDIDTIYITHQHGDHIGGLEYIAFCSYFDPTKEKIKLICNEVLLEELWETSLKGGLTSIQAKHMKLEDYFDVRPIQKNGRFSWEGIVFRTVQSVHVIDEYSIMSTYGLMFEYKEKKIYITGDTQFNPNQIIDFYKEADVIIQDCETALYMSKVHAHYNELKTLPKKIKKKMYLWHHQDNVEGSTRLNWQEQAKKDGFICFPTTRLAYTFENLLGEE